MKKPIVRIGTLASATAEEFVEFMTAPTAIEALSARNLHRGKRCGKLFLLLKHALVLSEAARRPKTEVFINKMDKVSKTFFERQGFKPERELDSQYVLYSTRQ